MTTPSIFSRHASTGYQRPPKVGDPGEAPTGVVTFARPAADPACAAETVARGAVAGGPSLACRDLLLVALAFAAVALIARYAWLLGQAVAT